jgi:hypothetical protein
MRLAALSLIVFAAAYAQADRPVLLHQTFADGTAGWLSMGQGGSMGSLAGTLEFAYEIKPKQFALAVLPAPPEIARLTALRFRVKTDHDTALAVLLSEKKPGGGNYTATFWAPAGQWQAIELSPSDFVASDRPTDPVDADSRLDLDQVEGVGIADLAQLFLAQPESPEFPVWIEGASGRHTLQIADFQIIGGSSAASRPTLAIDRFDRGFLEWITLGGMRLKLADSGNPLQLPALEASYERSEGRYSVMVRRLSNLDLSKATGLAFDIASRTEANVVVSLELKNGRRFNQSIFPPAGGEVFSVRLQFTDFNGEGKLDPAQLRSLALTDVSALEGGGGERNTLWIGRVAGVTTR